MFRNVANKTWFHNLLEGLIFFVVGLLIAAAGGFILYGFVEEGSQLLLDLGSIPIPIVIFPAAFALAGVWIAGDGFVKMTAALFRCVIQKNKRYKYSSR